MRTPRLTSASTLLIGLVLAAGCGGGSTPPPPANLAVTLYTSNPDVAAGASSYFSADVPNDGTVSGVTWSLAGDGALTFPSSTILSSPKFQAYYNAPATVSAQFNARVTATAVRDTSKTASVNLTVYPNVTIRKDPLPQAKAGAVYSYQITGGGGKGGALTYVLVSGPLPSGITLSRDGLLSGTPSAPGTYPLTIQAQDTTFTYTAAATGTYTLSVV